MWLLQDFPNTKAAKDRSLKVPGHAGVHVRPARTDIDQNRIWALRTAEELVKASPLAVGKTVTVKKDDGLGVYVNDICVFSQAGRHARGGTFLGEFDGLALP